MHGSTLDKSGSAKNIILFLDIDGVLHSTDFSNLIDEAAPVSMIQHKVDMVLGRVHPSKYGLLTNEKQQLLADVLIRNPHVHVVISSAWRNWPLYNFMSDEEDDDGPKRTRISPDIEWIKKLLHEAISEKIIGKTPIGSSRIYEIRRYMESLDKSLNYSMNWLALDDQTSHFSPDEVCYFYNEYDSPAPNAAYLHEGYVIVVNGKRGIGQESMFALEAAIKRISSPL
jgi:hypothetical protein